MSKRLASDRPGESYYITWRVPAVASGDDRFTVFVAPFDLEVEAAYLCPDTAMTGLATGQGMTVSLLDGGTAGAGSASMAAVDFTSTATVAAIYDAEPFTVSTGTLDAGDILLFDKAEEGTDAFALVAGTLVVQFKAQ